MKLNVIEKNDNILILKNDDSYIFDFTYTINSSGKKIKQTIHIGPNIKMLNNLKNVRDYERLIRTYFDKTTRIILQDLTNNTILFNSLKTNGEKYDRKKLSEILQTFEYYDKLLYIDSFINKNICPTPEKLMQNKLSIDLLYNYYNSTNFNITHPFDFSMVSSNGNIDEYKLDTLYDEHTFEITSVALFGNEIKVEPITFKLHNFKFTSIDKKSKSVHIHADRANIKYNK